MRRYICITRGGHILLIKNVRHFPGHHCASTGIRNIVNYHGIDWSEEICFGIGAGLGIWYIGAPGLSPSRIVHVRSEDLEAQFFNRLDCPFRWEQYGQPEESETALIRKLDSGIPVLLQTDIYYLPYYQSKTHFPGHVITVWGYNAKTKLFWVSDTEKKGLIGVPFPDLQKARYCSNGIFQSKGNLYAPETVALPSDIAAVIKRSVTDNSRALLESGTEYSGVSALEKWYSELAGWEDFSDWQWTARFAYQVIERRGTGGGGFRLLYSRFLDEAAFYVPQVRQLGLPGMMRGAASAWTGLAEALKAVSGKKKFIFGEIADNLENLRELETAYHRAALKLQA